MFIQNNSRRSAAMMALSALLLSVVGTLGFTGAAVADPGPEHGNIPAAATGSIIVHKHENQSGTGTPKNPDGTGNANLGAPLLGAGFTVYQLNDISGQPITGARLTDGTNNGWNAVTTASANPEANKGVVVKAEQLTDAAGVTTFADLPVGAYVVKETLTPLGVNQAAAPFVVTIPFAYTSGSTSKWLYDVNVYPKNTLTSIKKDVNAPGTLLLGAKVTFPVTVRVPALGTEKFTEFNVVDNFDTTKFTNLAVDSVTLDGATVPAANYTTGGNLGISFNADGLAQLNLASSQGKDLVVTFSGTVNAVGTLPNTATFTYKTTGNNNPPPTTSPAVDTRWGAIELTKQDASNPSALLGGAIFEVYEADASDAPTGTLVTTVTTDSAGKATVPGLYVGSSKDSVTEKKYVLVETKAPSGYVLPASPDNRTVITVLPGAVSTTQNTSTITNTKQTGPNLPLTGAAGQVLMTLGGLAIVAIAGGLLLVRRRQSQN